MQAHWDSSTLARTREPRFANVETANRERRHVYAPLLIDVIKIDRSFIQAIEHDPKVAAIAANLVASPVRCDPTWARATCSPDPRP